MFKKGAIIVLSSVILCGAVFAAKPAIKRVLGKKSAKTAHHVVKSNKVWPAKLGEPIQAIALDTVLPNGHMSVIVGDGQFAEVLFQPFTRTRLQGAMVSADEVQDGQRMVIWGKWDRNNPSLFKALAISCQDRLSDMVVRQKVAAACQNISQGRTVASVQDQEPRVVVMTAPAPTVAIPEMKPAPSILAPAHPTAIARVAPLSSPTFTSAPINQTPVVER